MLDPFHGEDAKSVDQVLKFPGPWRGKRESKMILGKEDNVDLVTACHFRVI